MRATGSRGTPTCCLLQNRMIGWWLLLCRPETWIISLLTQCPLTTTRGRFCDIRVVRGTIIFRFWIIASFTNTLWGLATIHITLLICDSVAEDQAAKDPNEFKSLFNYCLQNKNPETPAQEKVPTGFYFSKQLTKSKTDYPWLHVWINTGVTTMLLVVYVF